MNYDLDAFDTDLFEGARSVMKKRFSLMLEDYLEDAQMYIDNIKKGFAENDKQQVAQYAHPLKSSSSGIGIMSVSIIAKDLEHGAKEAIANDTEMTALNDMLDPIEEAFKRAEIKIRAEIESMT